jgi:hypothetical protein
MIFCEGGIGIKSLPSNQWLISGHFMVGRFHKGNLAQWVGF